MGPRGILWKVRNRHTNLHTMPIISRGKVRTEAPSVMLLAWFIDFFPLPNARNEIRCAPGDIVHIAYGDEDDTGTVKEDPAHRTFRAEMLGRGCQCFKTRALLDTPRLSIHARARALAMRRHYAPSHRASDPIVCPIRSQTLHRRFHALLPGLWIIPRASLNWRRRS